MNFVYLVIFWLIRSVLGDEVKTSFISSTYDWDSRSASVSATCVKIPGNLSLCNNMDYGKMRLPNLLEHETLSEISQQAASWVPLLNVRCHPDTQRFICSLFCPVCLDHPIYPCRSLCEKVKSGCESRMKMYGFPWPTMFACDQFPMDNDMCIRSQSVTDTSSEEKCKICEQVNTVANILDQYCQSSFAVKAKLKRIHYHELTFKIVRLFKAGNEVAKKFNDDYFRINLEDDCCRGKMKTRASYFIMGNYKNKSLDPIFIMPWIVKRSKSFKTSIHMLKTLNCLSPDAITQTVIDPTISAVVNPIQLESINRSEPTKQKDIW